MVTVTLRAVVSSLSLFRPTIHSPSFFSILHVLHSLGAMSQAHVISSSSTAGTASNPTVGQNINSSFSPRPKLTRLRLQASTESTKRLARVRLEWSSQVCELATVCCICAQTGCRLQVKIRGSAGGLSPLSLCVCFRPCTSLLDSYVA